MALLRFGLVALIVSLASTASAQPKASKTPTLSREFVDNLRAPSPLDLRTRTLLVQEIARLESLLRATSKKSPDRPLLLRRLAEGYAELAALAARDKVIADE